MRPSGLDGIAALLAGLALTCPSCAPTGPRTSATTHQARPVTERPLFCDVTAEVGLPVNETWPPGTYMMPEIMGGGVALFDYDGDGDLDLLEVRSPPPDEPGAPSPNRLYRQESGQFRDVSVAAGIADPGAGQGVAIGDVDGDGHPDVYITNRGRDAFFRNRGDGTFIDATSEAGFAGDAWSSSATFLDYDRDGDLDLFVVHYVDFDPRVTCRAFNGAPDYCSPNLFRPTVDALYRNDGSGRFSDVTAAAGIAQAGAGLGVVALDVTGDGWVDIVVANDAMVNHLWVNQHDGTFTEEAVIRGLSVSGEGKPEASMGIAVGDSDGDGAHDLLMTNLNGETNTLYLAGPAGVFRDGAAAAGLSAVDLQHTGFGTGFFDFDHDGDLDLAVVNGRVVVDPSTPAGAGFWDALNESNLLFRNRGGGHFEDASPHAGDFASGRELSRGLALGDVDGDGDLDLAVGNLPGVRLYRNDAPASDVHWLSVRCLEGRRDSLSAQVSVEVGGRRRVRMALAGSSYLSSSDPRVHFGLGSATDVDSLEVLWPDGRREPFGVPGVDRQITVIQGSGVEP